MDSYNKYSKMLRDQLLRKITSWNKREEFMLLYFQYVTVHGGMAEDITHSLIHIIPGAHNSDQ